VLGSPEIDVGACGNANTKLRRRAAPERIPYPVMLAINSVSLVGTSTCFSDPWVSRAGICLES